MTIFELLLFLFVAAVIGAVAQAIVGYSLGGWLVSIGVGFVGAVLGSWMARSMGAPELLVIQIGHQPFPLIWSIIGAALFVGVVSLLTRPRRTVVVTR